jgi:putative flippase GtrA
MRDGAITEVATAGPSTRMRRLRLGRFLLYAMVGAAGTAGHYALLIGLVSFGLMAPAPASVLGALLGALINFVLNATLTFAGAGHSHLQWRTAARFFATAGLAALLNGLAMLLLVDVLGLDYRLAQLLVTAVLLCATYAINAKWTFHAGKDR